MATKTSKPAAKKLASKPVAKPVLGKKITKGLGRGLDGLLGGDIDVVKSLQEKPVQATGTLSVNVLQAGKYQPRSHMDETGLNELAESIREQGLIQPILVRPLKNQTGRYEIIAGERRFRAAKIAGLSDVPVLIKEVSDQNAAIMALIENMQREDLNPLEEARGVERLLREFNYTHDQAAQAIGRSRPATSNLLRLLNLAAPVQTMLVAGDIEMGHARALLALESAEQIMIANQVASRRLSVRETEKLVSKTQAGELPSSQRKDKSVNRELERLQTKLSDLLATKVSFKLLKKESGQLIIDFHSWEHLNALLEKQGLSEVLDK